MIKKFTYRSILAPTGEYETHHQKLGAESQLTDIPDEEAVDLLQEACVYPGDYTALMAGDDDLPAVKFEKIKFFTAVGNETFITVQNGGHDTLVNLRHIGSIVKIK